MKERSPVDILKSALDTATNANVNIVMDSKIHTYIDYVCTCKNNRAGVRLLMSCALAKIHNPGVDPRKPYTEIGGVDSFSGRYYDEHYLTKFISDNHLPCNSTTAYLTPTFRNIDFALTPDRELVGTPREMYRNAILVLEKMATGCVTAQNVLEQIIRILIKTRDAQSARIDSLLRSQTHSNGSLPLSSEAIVNLIQQHLACKNASRLPVLIVASAYLAAEKILGEKVLPLNAHNAADSQTGSFGDIEICVSGDNNVVTAYEMKMKRVTLNDIDAAVVKIAKSDVKIDNYLFITTDLISEDVCDYAKGFYEKTGGTEIAILDCLGFIRHFLHLFHRLRSYFLDEYQQLVLNEPDSAVSQSLKEVFLTLRQVAETGE